MAYGFGGRGGSANWEKIGGRKVVGLLGKNKNGDKDVWRFSFPIDEEGNTYLTLNVYASSFNIDNGRNAGKQGKMAWATMSRRKNPRKGNW